MVTSILDILTDKFVGTTVPVFSTQNGDSLYPMDIDVDTVSDSIVMGVDFELGETDPYGCATTQDCFFLIFEDGRRLPIANHPPAQLLTVYAVNQNWEDDEENCSIYQTLPVADAEGGVYDVYILTVIQVGDHRLYTDRTGVPNVEDVVSVNGLDGKFMVIGILPMEFI